MEKRRKRRAVRRGPGGYEHIFSDASYWRQLGEEYQSPLIITGTIHFSPHQVSGMVSREREVYDALGRRRVVPLRAYQDRRGFVLSPRFVFIDGGTGATPLHRTAPRRDSLRQPAEHAAAPRHILSSWTD